MWETGFPAPRGRRSIDVPLTDQLEFNKDDVERRLRFLRLDQRAAQALTALSPIIVRNIDAIVENLYDTLTEIPEFDELIGDANTFKDVAEFTRFYVLDLFDGAYGRAYVVRRLQIGSFHARTNISPEMFASATTVLNEVIEQYIEAEASARGINPVTVRNGRSALSRLLTFDIELIYESYVRAQATRSNSRSRRLEDELMKRNDSVDELKGRLERASQEISAYAECLEESVTELNRLRKGQQDTAGAGEDNGLASRAVFVDYLRRQMAFAARSRSPLTLASIGLKQGPQSNDNTNIRLHKDEMLSDFGKALSNFVRETDIACRYDEHVFHVVLPSTSEQQAAIFRKRLEEVMRKEFPDSITTNIGITQLDPEASGNAEEVVQRADEKIRRMA